MASNFIIDPARDLIFERKTTVSQHLLWRAWTQPDILKQWFCPNPWRVVECRIDLQPGGEFYSLMQGPKGEQAPNHGCYLEVIDSQKLVWTNMMTKGYRPQSPDKFGFQYVATLLLSKIDGGTFYRAVVSHADELGKKKHEEMGFQEGWGLAFDQLIQLLSSSS